jgi:hypothetical protein
LAGKRVVPPFTVIGLPTSAPAGGELIVIDCGTGATYKLTLAPFACS